MLLLDGKKISNEIAEEIKSIVTTRQLNNQKIPKLIAVLVGEDPASASYVRSKEKKCAFVGFDSQIMKLPATISEDELLKVIDHLNNDESVDGFIVQLPLPKGINETTIKMAIDPVKDVDGFHPMNLGKMVAGLPGHLPATPQGILELLRRYKIETSGKKCVIIGRSQIVGTPMSILLSKNSDVGNCTVTLLHSRSQNVKEECLNADIIIAAIGKPHFVTADMVKEGAVIIDVGINRVEDATKKRGYKLVGDVDFENVAPKCSYITPVPGGVGPLTVISLMLNTLNSIKN